MKALVLGTAGHVDHGKTTLVRALTGTETDRWEEEKRRGLTIDIGFARLEDTGEMEIGVVDVPGHEDFVKNMLAGATGIDLLLLVVAADEGPMPQTREHLAIARMLGVRVGVIALTKIDRVDREWLDLAAEAAADEVRTVLGVDWPVIEVSSTQGQGLDALRAAIVSAATAVEEPRSADILRLPVDRAFSIAGAGTVVTGTVWSGQVEVGQTVRLLPDGKRARVRGAQVHGESRQLVPAGRRCAISLVGLETSAVGRGTVVVDEPAWQPVKRVGVRLQLLPFVRREVEHGQRIRVFLGTAETMAKVLLENRRTISPGETGWAVLESETPFVCRAGDRFVVRFYSPVTTIGGGVVAELDPPRRWRGRTREWQTILEGDRSDVVLAAVRLAGAAGVERDRLPLVTGLMPPEVGAAAAVLDKQVVELGRVWFSGESLASARKAVRTELTESHARRPRERGVSLESLRSSVAAEAGPVLAAEAVQALAAEGLIVIDGPLARLPEHEPTLTDQERSHMAAVHRVLDQSGLEPAPPAELARRLSLDRALLNDLLRLLSDEGKLVAISPEMTVTARVLDGARSIVEGVLEEGGTVSPSQFREALGTSRRYLIPLLEYFDRENVTRRTPDGRVRGETQST